MIHKNHIVYHQEKVVCEAVFVASSWGTMVSVGLRKCLGVIIVDGIYRSVRVIIGELEESAVQLRSSTVASSGIIHHHACHHSCVILHHSSSIIVSFIESFSIIIHH